jgi:hypothetical protein
VPLVDLGRGLGDQLLFRVGGDDHPLSTQQSSAHLLSIPISADFPMPWPEATAIMHGSNLVLGLAM